jgi:hypothetical protein
MYITPRVLIQQEFTQLPVYREFPLPAFIVGPQFALTRYSEASEKPFTAPKTYNGEYLLSGNSYLPDTDTTYDVPNVPAGGLVDKDYTKVYAEAVEAQYFPNTQLGSQESDADDIQLLTGPTGQKYTNRVRFTSAVLKTANGYDRSSFLSGRDVAVNDIIQVTDNLGNSVRGKIMSLRADSATNDEDLESTIGKVLESGADGVTNGTTLFTSASAIFTDEMVGKFISITGVGVRKILARTSNTVVILNAAVATGTNRSYFVEGVYNDPANTPTATELLPVAPTHVAGTGSTTGVTVQNTSTGYEGYNSRNILEDTYTVEVTTGGNLAAARFAVSSQALAFPDRQVVALDAGDVLTVDNFNGNDVKLDFTGTTNFTVGTKWTLGVRAAVTQVNPQANAADPARGYTGPSDMVYKVFVERGGAFFDPTANNFATCARLVISASDVDTSSAVLPQLNTAFNVGSFGVVAKFTAASNNGGLITGDVYYIPVTSERLGRVRIVEFSEDMPDAMVNIATSWAAKLFLVQKSIQVPAVRDMVEGTTNWSIEENYITINSGITSYDNRLTAAGAPARLTVAKASLFVEHRDLLQDNINAIDSVRSLADVTTKLGTVHPDNPLAQGVYDAVLNSNNMMVYFIGVESNDLNGYTKAIKISEKSDKVYSFAPLTFDRVIQDAVVAHVNAYSTAEVGRWRIAWLSVKDAPTKVMYDLKEDGTSYQATITDDPGVSGTQYKLVTMPGAKFIEDGIRPNDRIRMNFRLNPDGKVIYDEYVVDTVRTQTSLTITRPLPSPISGLTKAQVVRVYTRSERANNVALIGGEYNNRRVRVVFPDTFKYGNVTKEGYFAAAGLAGLRSGVVPHQGLTNTEYLGADDLSKVVIEYTQDELNVMAEQGIWLITQEVVGATPYVRHQLTTDERSLNTSEDSITTNVDSISYALKATLEPFIGRFNINPENLLVVRNAIVSQLTFRATSTWTVRAGNQLVSFTPKDDILRLEQNATYKDRIDVEVRLNVPYPMNYINLKLIV